MITLQLLHLSWPLGRKVSVCFYLRLVGALVPDGASRRFRLVTNAWSSCNLWDCSHSGDQPGVQQQVVEAGFDDAFPPLPVLIRLVELLAQSLLIRVAAGQLEGPQGQTQLGTITQTCGGTEGSDL